MIQIDRGPGPCYCDGLSLAAISCASEPPDWPALGPRNCSAPAPIRSRPAASPTSTSSPLLLRCGRWCAGTWRASWLTAVEGCGGEEAARELGLRLGEVYLAKCRVMAQLKEHVRRLQDE